MIWLHLIRIESRELKARRQEIIKIKSLWTRKRNEVNTIISVLSVPLKRISPSGHKNSMTNWKYGKLWISGRQKHHSFSFNLHYHLLEFTLKLFMSFIWHWIRQIQNYSYIHTSILKTIRISLLWGFQVCFYINSNLNGNIGWKNDSFFFLHCSAIAKRWWCDETELYGPFTIIIEWKLVRNFSMSYCWWRLWMGRWWPNVIIIFFVGAALLLVNGYLLMITGYLLP